MVALSLHRAAVALFVPFVVVVSIFRILSTIYYENSTRANGYIVDRSNFVICHFIAIGNETLNINIGLTAFFPLGRLPHPRFPCLADSVCVCVLIMQEIARTK